MLLLKVRSFRLVMPLCAVWTLVWCSLCALATVTLAQTSRATTPPHDRPSFHRFVAGRDFKEDSREFQIANRVVQRLIQSNQLPNFQWVIAESKDDIEQVGSSVWVLAPVIRALQNDPGRLAFVIAHDIATYGLPTKANDHIICTDDSKEKLAQLGYSKDLVVRSRAECEARSDSLAITYMARAGFSPYDGSGFLGDVTTKSDVEHERDWVQSYVELHGTSQERVEKLRRSIASFCRTNKVPCQMASNANETAMVEPGLASNEISSIFGGRAGDVEAARQQEREDKRREEEEHKAGIKRQVESEFLSLGLHSGMAQARVKAILIRHGYRYLTSSSGTTDVIRPNGPWNCSSNDWQNGSLMTICLVEKKISIVLRFELGIAHRDLDTGEVVRVRTDRLFQATITHYLSPGDYVTVNFAEPQSRQCEGKEGWIDYVCRYF
jgi:hypothetical protein